MMNSDVPAIDVKNATVVFGHKRVLDSLDFFVNKGTIVGLVGPNGVGKTTLLRLIAGLIPGAAACVCTNGKPFRERSEIKRKIFFVEDLRLLDLNLSGWTYLRYIKKLWRSNVSTRDVIEYLGIGSFVRKPLRKLSQGMQQQVLMALALISSAPIILFDEPMNSMDPSNIEIASQKLRDVRDQGTTILLSTHLLANVDELADGVAFLKSGQVGYFREKGSQRSSAELYRELYLSPSAN